MAITDKNIDVSFFYKGIMEKPIVEMSEAEREDYYKLSAIKLKKRLFSINQPLVYEKNGEIIAEYANGKVELLKNA